MKTQDIDDAQIEARDFADKLEVEFDDHFYKDRPKPPEATLENFPQQVFVLRQALEMLQTEQPPPAAMTQVAK